MTVGELFAGIGGLGLGLERAGMEVKWAVEYDPYAAAVYRKNFPDVLMVEQDITTVDFGTLSPVDLIAGGFPCQDISYAGKGAGIEGSRSGLWKELWGAIRDVRPRLVLVENVPALLSRGLGVVLGDLASIGYDAEWDCIPAAAVGAPHRRDRVFVVAYSQRKSNDQYVGVRRVPIKGLKGAGEWGTHWLKLIVASGDVAPSEWKDERHGVDSRPLLVRDDDGVPGRLDRLRCLGNAVVPQVAEFVGRRIMEVYGSSDSYLPPDK